MCKGFINLMFLIFNFTWLQWFNKQCIVGKKILIKNPKNYSNAYNGNSKDLNSGLILILASI